MFRIILSLSGHLRSSWKNSVIDRYTINVLIALSYEEKTL